MSVLIKHSKVSTIPDTDDTSLVRPSDWNADHVVVGAAESGANSDITSLSGITGGISTPDFVQFDTAAAETSATGKLFWDDGDGVPSVGLKGGLVTLQIGTQEFARVFNDSGTTLTKGQAVYISGAQGNRVAVRLARADVEATSFGTIGLVAETMTAGAEGFIIVSGALYKLNTMGLVAGATVYVSPTTAGALTTTKPQAPDQLVVVGWVERVNATVGSIYVKVDNGYELDELHDVQINGPTTGQTLVYNGTTSVWQNSNAPTISGGTINNTPIGATTPSTVNATTITGQTGVLRGTGQNLSLQSEQVNLWGTPTAATVVTDATTSPTGTSNADKLQENTANSNHFLSSTNQSLNYVLGITYTRSCYIKQDGRKYVSIFFPSTNFPSTGRTAIFDVNAGTVYLAEAGVTAIITSVGNGWFRCSIAVTCTVAGSGHTGGSALYDNSGNSVYLGDGTSGAFLWGAQVELGSTANTYIPTTTTAVYGTPTLSFSGVSEIGLLSTGALYLQPAGTGAIQAQATTSTSAGGNARGANAVDWQTLRDTAARVASATSSVVSGGSYNTANAQYGVVAGGGVNTASGYAGVVSGGYNNTASGIYAGVGGGQTNTASGYYGFVGNGFTNSTTSNSAVTTQSGTMNGTTAVTLSGSNANIKVGQYITGTSIAGDTYVAAISGTALTLSKVASGSSTSTLSFFTPHGVVVGGGNNQATGAYSFIGGGGDAGTSGNRNVASGDYAVVVGGRTNTASGIAAFVGGGGFDGASVLSNTASNSFSVVVGGASNISSGFGGFVGGGASNTASGTYSGVVFGNSNTANGNSSSVFGGRWGNARSITGNTVFSPSNNPIGTSASGTQQTSLVILARQTTDATATVLTSDTSAAGTTNQVILPNNSAYYFRGEVIAGKTAGGDTKGWYIEGVIKRGANAASTAIVGTATVTSNYADAGASTWAVTATADTTNGGLKITVTGQASTTIRWVAQIRTTEMTF